VLSIRFNTSARRWAASASLYSSGVFTMEISTPEAKAIWEEMHNASERTQAIVASAFLEDKLTDLLRAYLRKDKTTTDKLFKPGKLLGGLGPKADLGFLLSLYSKEFRNDLVQIGAIRNAFAHWAERTTFETKEIRGFCEKLEFQDRLFAHGGPPEPRPFAEGIARFIFISTVDMMCGHIIEMTRNPNHPKVL
jgi:hypothetical protein